MSFKWLRSDPSVYIWMTKSTKVIILVFIDNLTLVSDSKEEIDRVKQYLANSFKLKDLGPITSLLGVDFEHNRENHTLKLKQEHYIWDILERF